MRSARRPLPVLLLALIALGHAAPLVAITCVPSAPCAGLMAGGHFASAEQGAGPTVSSPDCCERSERQSERPAMPGAKVGDVAVSALPAVAADSPPALPRAALHRAIDGPAAGAAIPLYTLHSILLI